MFHSLSDCLATGISCHAISITKSTFISISVKKFNIIKSIPIVLLFSSSAKQALNEEIAGRDSELKAAFDCGAKLREYAAETDAKKLDADLNRLSNRYLALSELGRTRLEQMRKVPDLLERFHVAHGNVLTWVQQIENELNQCEVKSGLEAELHLKVK